MKKISLLVSVFFAICFTHAQTSLSVGDIAFLGSNTDAGSTTVDNISFVLLKDIDAATQIIFTDRGWNDTGGFYATNGDGELTWTSGSARSAGDIIILDLTSGSLSDNGAYASIGDQLFALQGSIANPQFIAGLHFNVATTGTDDANWDGAATTNSTSALPNALTTGNTAVRLYGAGGIEQDNFQFSCTVAGGSPITGTPAVIRAILHNAANWVSNNDTGFNPPVEAGCTISIASNADMTPPTITCAATPSSIQAGINGTTTTPDLVSGSSATDNISAQGNIVITQSPAIGASIGVGVNMVTITATDEAGNSTSCMVDVTVTEPPFTSLTAGDIAFVGFNLDGTDAFAFIILEDIIAGTNIKFTDCGATNPNVINCILGDAINTWYAPTTISAGTIITLDGSFFPGGTLAIQGDQLLAFQGTTASPTFLAGIHSNIEAGVTNDADWDGASINNDESALPDQLTNGVNALRVHAMETEVDNWQLDCSSLPPGALTGSKQQIAAVINNIQYWVGNDSNEYIPTVNPACIFTVMADNTAPTLVSTDPVDDATDIAIDAVFTATFDEPVEWVPGGSNITLINLTTGVSHETFNEGNSTVTFTGNTLSINTTTDLITGNEYEIRINPSSVQDAAGNAFTGNAVNSWTFTTVEPCEVTIVQEPQDVDVTVCDIEPLGIFRVEASGSGTLTYLWEEKISGSCCTWSALTVNENTLEIATEALAAANGSKFRVTVTSDNGTPGDITDDCSVTSDEVTLTTVTLEPKPDIPVNLGLQTNLGGGLPAQGTQLGDIGVYSGPGVIDDGNGLTYSFDPEVAGEGIKTITYTYTNGNGCTSSATDEIVILPAKSLIYIGDVTQVEGTGGTTSFVFQVSLSRPSTETLTINYSTLDNFAVSPDDYNAVSGILTFSPGETSKGITIDVVPDSEVEPDETFLVQMSILRYNDDFWFLRNRGTGAILNDDKECEVVIETQPMDVVVCEFEPYSFSVGATGNGMLSYQWEVSVTNGVGWEVYPNATENILDVPEGVSGGDGALFRVIVTSDNGTPNDTTDDCSEISETATLTVNPLPVVAITGKDSYCNNDNGVELDAGAGHSSYLWSPGGATTQTISATEGSYTVQVTNEFGCTKISEVFKVTNNQPLVCNILQDVLATNYLTADGVATVNTTGGAGQFTYLWDNGETTQTATTLTYGMHSVTVTDSNGCETTCQIDIAKELYCWTNLVQNVSVLGGNDGEAMVKGNGGYRPYTFRWDDGTTNEVNAALTPGTHYVTITDASGATSQCSVTITEPNKGNCNDLVSTVEQDKLATNHVTEDGVATVYPKGGSGQYMYLWDNGETTQTATTLTYGIHTVTITDTTGCISIAQIDIAKELYCWINLYKNVSVHDAKDGSAMVHGNGGYRPHTFLWDDGSTEQLNSNLKAGTHYVTITDATGATSQCSITITEPNEEVCDGIDNDGDGQIDEGFDKDGDGIADCFDICDKGDDYVDMDNDGIPDACDDNICIKVEKPMTECYQTAVWDQQTCSWIISGEKPLKPKTECNQTAEWNGTTCTWDITDGQRPEMPMTECYQMASWNTQTCSWDITGDKPMEPMTECHQTAEWNGTTCTWDIENGQPEMPMTLCYQTAVWSDQICDWEINGEKPIEPETECYQTAVFNEITCTWDIENGQPEMPMTLCYQTAVWSDQICDWEINGEKPIEPETECYQTAVFNEITCTWDIENGQPEMPVTLCYQTAVWSDQICDWEINGEQPTKPETECYQMAAWNELTCSWDITGEQPPMPETECNETAVWDEMTCDWGIIENNNDCGSGTIDQCETAFARSGDETIRTCFLELPNVSGNRWGWTNEFPSTNGTYNMDLYAAAGQCTISNGALVGNVEVTYTDGAVQVTVSTLPGNKMTVAQLYVGTEVLPTGSNGRFTTAPGQFPYSDTVEGDFYSFTFESVNVGNSGNFYVVLHADVCPNDTLPSKTASANLDLTAYPVPFKENLNIKVASPLNMNGTLSLYNGVGQKVQDFGSYTLKKGENEINLNTVELPIGLYFIRMTSVYGTETLKILRK